MKKIIAVSLLASMLYGGVSFAEDERYVPNLTRPSDPAFNTPEVLKAEEANKPKYLPPSLGGFAGYAYEGDIKVNWNGDVQLFNQVAYKQDGTIMVPMRSLFGCMGILPDWDYGTQTVRALAADFDIILKLGSKQAYVNGDTVTLDAAPVMKDGTTMIPYTLLKATGSQVTWDEQKQTVFIKGKIHANYVPPKPAPATDLETALKRATAAASEGGYLNQDGFSDDDLHYYAQDMYEAAVKTTVDGDTVRIYLPADVPDGFALSGYYATGAREHGHQFWYSWGTGIPPYFEFTKASDRWHFYMTLEKLTDTYPSQVAHSDFDGKTGKLKINEVDFSQVQQ